MGQQQHPHLQLFAAFFVKVKLFMTRPCHVHHIFPLASTVPCPVPHSKRPINPETWIDSGITHRHFNFMFYRHSIVFGFVSECTQLYAILSHADSCNHYSQDTDLSPQRSSVTPLRVTDFSKSINLFSISDFIHFNNVI